jgi:hypothetical protein
LEKSIDYVEGYKLVFDRYSKSLMVATANLVENPKERGNPPRGYIETIIEGTIENGLPFPTLSLNKFRCLQSLHLFLFKVFIL